MISKSRNKNVATMCRLAQNEVMWDTMKRYSLDPQNQCRTTEISHRDPTGKDYHQSQSEKVLGSEIGFRKNYLSLSNVL